MGSRSQTKSTMLIASGAIYVDLNVVPIAEPERVRIFTTAKMAAANEAVSRETCEGIRVRSIGGPFCESPDVHSEAFLLLAAAGEPDLIAIANRRFDIVNRHLAGRPDAMQHAGQNIASLDSAVSVCQGALWFRLFGAAPEDQ